MAMFASSDNVELPMRVRDLGKDSGTLYRHSKVCCETPGRVCSENIVLCMLDASTTT